MPLTMGAAKDVPRQRIHWRSLTEMLVTVYEQSFSGGHTVCQVDVGAGVPVASSSAKQSPPA